MLKNCIFTFRHLKENFLAPDFYLNCFFFVSLSYSIKEYCYFSLVDPNTAVQCLPFVVEVLYLSKALYLRGKASQLAVLNFNKSLITHLVALKCGSARELVISVILNSVGQPQPTYVPCFNWWTWRE